MKILVTGGGGFLGRHIVEKLLSRGDEALSLSRKDHPELVAIGARTIRADIADRQKVIAACEGVDMVFHTSAKVGIWGDRQEFYDTNVTGTDNVIAGCLKHGVKRLVYTSSPSVIFDGESHELMDESHPYPTLYYADYPASKAVAEQAVISANSDKLYTCVLRPHLIWGPRDTNLIPRLIERARAGGFRMIGDGKNIVDAVYVENAAHAHILASEKLGAGSPVNGSVYFITNGEPVILWDWINEILKTFDAPPVTKRLPYKTAYRLGALMEFLYKIGGFKSEPVMTRFLAMQLSMSHSFSIEKAKVELGYEPVVSMKEGMRLLG